ncbi:MAG: NAD(+) synthase [Planctomycetota bacterium]|nr:NAD(+) synthase [Planctomycetota bacterium]MDA1212780.1 NAD(+) synthase [Planctomycetota bacterium]
MKVSIPFTADVLRLDYAAEIDRLCAWMHETVFRNLRKKGVVLGLSGGIDSSVCAALCVRALGPDKVFGIMMPEHDSEDDSLSLGEHLAEHLGIETAVENISGMLEGAGCYRRRDEAIRQVVPTYGPGCKMKIVLPNLLTEGGYRLFSVVVQTPEGEQIKKRLPLAAYQTIVAATNFKQRCRKMMEYFHGDRLNYAVIGTPNRLEYDQGFFVKQGDGAADLKPIAHLYKTQVYALAEALDVPEIIRQRPPTTDTYSLPQSQEEFYFAVPYDVLDLCLYGKNHNIPAEVVAPAAKLTAEHVELVYGDIDAKRKATRYLHLAPQVAEEFPELI